MQADFTHLAADESTNHPPALPTSSALFLDFDGTLAPIAERPQDVQVPGWVVPTLESLRQRLQGAIAVVSGRSLPSIDAYLHPLSIAAAGGHGAERRSSAGHVERQKFDPPQSIVVCARALAAQHSGLVLEIKPTGIAVHYRLRPELESMCRRTLDEALARVMGAGDEWEWMSGKYVYELKLRGVSKGVALRAFLSEAPFAGRLPIFVGDDVTDEDGFQAAQEAGGFGVRVGVGPTQAHYRLADTDAVALWLADDHLTGAR